MHTTQRLVLGALNQNLRSGCHALESRPLWKVNLDVKPIPIVVGSGLSKNDWMASLSSVSNGCFKNASEHVSDIYHLNMQRLKFLLVIKKASTHPTVIKLSAFCLRSVYMKQASFIALQIITATMMSRLNRNLHFPGTISLKQYSTG